MNVTLIVIFGLLGFFGLIVLAVIMVKRHSKWFKKDDDKPTESQIVKEELDRVLEKVDNEETIKAMAEYDQQKIVKKDENNNKASH
ncbi:MAG: hypothetical protein MJ207_01945 [Bacilli bacterium]|nr:hypothetical protein [Bacilli bacterium]